MVELRKRKAPAPPPVEKKAKSVKPAAKSTTKPAAKPASTPVSEPASKQDIPQVGDSLELEDFGGEFETNEGQKTSLKALVEESKTGVVIFTYPKASTPGC